MDVAAATAAIAGMLDDWHDAAAKADEDRYFSHLADASIFMGTDATERWDKAAFRAYAHPHFAKGKAWTMRATRRAVIVDPEGELAHFDEDLETASLGPARGSGVVKRADSSWIILHYNLTITVPNDRFDVVKEAAGPARLLGSEADVLADLGFISGSWSGPSAAGEIVEEHWTHAAGGTLLGSVRVTKDGKTVFFEHVRIEQRADGSVVYVAQPLGKPPTEFKRTSATSKTKVVFENPKHDWPKKITYAIDAGKLSTRVEGDAGKPVETTIFEPVVIRRAR